MRVLLFVVNLLQSPLCGRAKSILGKRLQQIIHRVDLEGAECVAIVGCREDDARQAGIIVSRERANDVEPIHVRHSDIEKKKIRFGGANKIDRLRRSSAFAYDFDLGYLSEELPQLLACKNLVICNYSLNHHAPYLAD